SRHSFGARVSLLAGPVEAVEGRFSLVAANMLPAEMLPLAGALTARAAPGGRLLLSGIPVEEESAVLARFPARAWRHSGRRRAGGWGPPGGGGEGEGVFLRLERAS